jgi:S1-C subfamily serine protease
MKTRWIVAAAWLALAGPAAAQPPVAELAQSVVRIVNYSQRGDWYAPWQVGGVSESQGSGFVIDGGLIMTNAHVVSDSRYLLVFLHNDPNPYPAQVYQVAHDSDLALVRLEDPAPLADVPPLELGPVPALGTRVDTLGYPTGGTQLSSTRGVVSRIDVQLYLHSGKDGHLAGQTDAAINPGNSGGPVVQDGRVVGVAFQAMPDLQSVGYFIPPGELTRFLADVEDGRYDGYPDLGVEEANLENPAARARYGLREDETGVRIHLVRPETSADGLVQEGDVLLAIDGRPLANDGSVLDGDQRIHYGMLVDRRQVGEVVTLRLLRDGERLDVEVPLANNDTFDKHGHRYDQLPRYFVYGGLVFVPLDRELLQTSGEAWWLEADRLLLYEFAVRPKLEIEQWPMERVVLLRRLDHPVNANLAWWTNEAVERVNGRAIERLEDLIAAFENHDGDQHLIEFSSHRRFAVLDREAAEEANEEILARYGIPEDRRL